MKKKTAAVLFGGVIFLLIGGVYVFFKHESGTPESLSKADREMDAYDAQGRLLKTYPVALGFNPVGHKQFEGDGKTPEGRYPINDRNPNSGYHKNLGVSYPNDADRAYAAAQGKSAGGDIKIHGMRNGMGAIGAQHLHRDWTHGCIAVTAGEIDELYALV